ncbi:uncharacterized protein LOC120351656, partial [Nilaparvata lugens]|uniref:uncharacterized protein LOC120351656 n=1 Tax=Nilaparvata lugens TaxID=108931 RepID=UPI00193CC825
FKKRSLILVEDADLLFEGFDEGFISAIAALSLTSKRHLVFTVNNKKPQHFSKFVRPSDLMLEFQRPSSSNLVLKQVMVIAVEMASTVHVDHQPPPPPGQCGLRSQKQIESRIIIQGFREIEV